VHHPKSRLRQSSGQTENPSQTCFDAKQAARFRCVSRADLPPSVLRRNRQTKAHLVLRPKPRNRRGDFEASNHQTKAAGFEAHTGKPSTTLVLRLNQETRAPSLQVPGGDRTRRHPTARPPSTRPVRPSTVLCTRSPTPVIVLIAARHAAPATCTPRDKQTRFSERNKDKRKTKQSYPEFKFKPRQVNDSS
jgi:hypothetical protein